MPDAEDTHAHGPLTGVARDASTLAEALSQLEAKGFDGQLAARDGGVIECAHCNAKTPVGDFEECELLRLEGASDPADMLAVVAATCPACQTKGTLVLNYGPEASPADAEILQGLEPK